MTTPNTFDPVGRHWLDALDHPDSGAWDELDRAHAELPDGHLIRKVLDFLALDPAERRPRSTPIVDYCAQRVRTEPGAFARCLVELATYGSLLDPNERISPRFVARQLVASRPLLGPLATVYDRETWKILDPTDGKCSIALYEARRRILESHDTADLDPATWEILVSILEVEIDVYHAYLAVLAVDRVLDELMPLVDECPIPYRQVPVLYRLGRHLASTARAADAATVLARADRELPADLDDALRVDILTMRAFALAMRGEAHYDEATRCHQRADALVKPYGVRLGRRHPAPFADLLRRHIAELDHLKDHRARTVDPNRSLGYAVDGLLSAASLRRLRRDWLPTGGADEPE